MSLVKWTFIALVMLPAAEIAVFMLIALLIGWLWTVAVFVATSVAGVVLLRRSGRGDLDRVRAAFAKDGFRAVHLETPGFAPILAAILLILPGFITDVLGLALLLPWFRRWAGAALGRAARKRRHRRSTGDVTVIDLEPDEWRQIPDRRPKSEGESRPKSVPKSETKTQSKPSRRRSKGDA